MCLTALLNNSQRSRRFVTKAVKHNPPSYSNFSCCVYHNLNSSVYKKKKHCKATGGSSQNCLWMISHHLVCTCNPSGPVTCGQVQLRFIKRADLRNCCPTVERHRKWIFIVRVRWEHDRPTLNVFLDPITNTTFSGGLNHLWPQSFVSENLCVVWCTYDGPPTEFIQRPILPSQTDSQWRQVNKHTIWNTYEICNSSAEVCQYLYICSR